MSSAILWVLLALGVVNAVLVGVLLARSPAATRGRADPLRDELRAGREEAGRAARESRDELSRSLAAANQTLAVTLASMSEVQRAQLDGL